MYKLIVAGVGLLILTAALHPMAVLQFFLTILGAMLAVLLYASWVE